MNRKQRKEQVRKLEEENAELKMHIKDVENDSNNCEQRSLPGLITT